MYRVKKEPLADVCALIRAACEVMADNGVQGASTRIIAQRANVSPSLITFKYGGLSQLLVAALGYARQEDSEAWSGLGGRLSRIDAPQADLGGLMHSALREMFLSHPRLSALRWLDMHEELRRAQRLNSMSAWLSAPAEFWANLFGRLCPRSHLIREEDWALFALTMFNCGQSYLGAGASVEFDMWLRDLSVRLAERCMGQTPSLAGDSVWRQHLVSYADTVISDEKDARRHAIVSAAADILLDRGLGAVTHRAIAAQAGVSLASTTRHFASLDEILSLACIDIFTRTRTVAKTYQTQSAALEDLLSQMEEAFSGGYGWMPRSLNATLEITGAILRIESARPLALAMQARIGESGSLVLAGLDCPGGTDRIDGHLFSQMRHAAAFLALCEDPHIPKERIVGAVRRLTVWWFGAG